MKITFANGNVDKILLAKSTLDSVAGIDVGCLFTGVLDGDHDSEVRCFLQNLILSLCHSLYNRWMWTGVWASRKQLWRSTASLFPADSLTCSSPRQTPFSFTFVLTFFSSGGHLHPEAGRCAHPWTCEGRGREWRPDDSCRCPWRCSQHIHILISGATDAPQENVRPWPTNQPLPKVLTKINISVIVVILTMCNCAWSLTSAYFDICLDLTVI